MKKVCKYRQPNEGELDGEFMFGGLNKELQINTKKEDIRKNRERKPSLKNRSKKVKILSKAAKQRRKMFNEELKKVFSKEFIEQNPSEEKISNQKVIEEQLYMQKKYGLIHD